MPLSESEKAQLANQMLAFTLDKPPLEQLAFFRRLFKLIPEPALETIKHRLDWNVAQSFIRPEDRK